MPYSLLDERTRRVGRESVREAVCTLLAYGYSLEPLSQERGMSLKIISYSSLQFTLIYCNQNKIMNVSLIKIRHCLLLTKLMESISLQYCNMFQCCIAHMHSI